MHNQEADVPKGVSLRDVSAAAFIRAFAAHLKKQGKLEQPKWVEIVKTGSGRELNPMDPDWFFVRTASIIRKVYLRPGVGMGALRRLYGGSKRNGTFRNSYADGSGSVIRQALIQLQKLGLVEVIEDGSGGRRITSEGQRMCDQISGQVVNDA